MMIDSHNKFKPGWDSDDGEPEIVAVSPDGRRIATCARGLGEGMLPRSRRGFVSW